MTAWIFSVVAILGAVTSLALARRLATPRTYVAPHAEFGPAQPVDHQDAELRSRVRQLEHWVADSEERSRLLGLEARHISTLLLELRLADSEMRDDGERELGDVRRVIANILNRLDRLDAARNASVALDAEVEDLGSRLNIAIASLSSRLDQIELKKTRTADR